MPRSPSASATSSAAGHINLAETLAERIAEACFVDAAGEDGAGAGGEAACPARRGIGRRRDRAHQGIAARPVIPFPPSHATRAMFAGDDNPVLCSRYEPRLADRSAGERARSRARHASQAYLKTLPDAPGVYRMLDAKGDVLYVGKAKSLKKRVSAYAKSGGHNDRITRMIAETAEMLFVTTASETEALLLETNLIKRLKPRFNVSFRDDKSFPNILLREDHPFPQLLKHRGAKTAKGVYFGPFASAGAVNRTLNTLQRAFLLRSCSDSVFEARTRPCLLFQIKRCSAPCVGRIDESGLCASWCDEAEAFLTGKSRTVQDGPGQGHERGRRGARFRTRRAAARPHPRHEPYPLQPGHQSHHLQRRRCVRGFAAGRADLHPGVLLPRRPELGQPALFPARPRPSCRAAKCSKASSASSMTSGPAPPLILAERRPARARRCWPRRCRCAWRSKVEIAVPQRGEKRDIVEMALTNAREQLGRRMAENAAQRELLEGVADTVRPGGAAARASRSTTIPTSRAPTRWARMIVAGPGRLREGRIPQVQHQIGRPHARRRLRHDARSADPPLRPPGQGQNEDAIDQDGPGQMARSGPDRWRAGPALDRPARCSPIWAWRT